MSSYSFANYADRVVGLRLSLTAAGLQAVRFKRTKTAPNVFTPDPAEQETVTPVTQPFSFTVGVPAANQTGLLGVEVVTWSPIIYVTTSMFALGKQDAFAGNGNETNTAPSAPAPGGPSMANRMIRFDFTPAAGGYGSTLHWKGDAASGVFVFSQANPGYIVALRLNAPNGGQLVLPAGNPWGAAATVGW
jgi:hypothetical protein